MSLHLNHINKTLIVFLLLCTSFPLLKAQPKGGISVRFLKGDTEMQLNEFATNVLGVINHSGNPQKVDLSVIAPAGWQLLGTANKSLTIEANDSLFVPIRLRPGGQMKGDQSYVSNAILSVNGFTVTNAVWNIAIKKKSLWNVGLSSNRIYFPESSDTVSYAVTITNNGNADESLLVETFTENGLYLLDKKQTKQQNNLQIIQLKVGKDTLLRFNVIKDRYNEYPLNNYTEDVERYRLKIKVRNERQKYARGAWTGAVNFIKLPSERNVEESFLSSFPLTVEWNSYNILEENTYGSLGLYGSKSIDESRNFTYYYQGNFVENEFDWQSMLGNYFYLGYFSPDYNVEIGNITTGRSGSQLIGTGAKASYKYKNHRLGGLYIGNPGIFDAPYLTGFGGFYNVEMKKLRADVYFESSKNTAQDITSSFSTADINYRINPQHQVQVGAGFSSDNYSGYGVEGVTGYRATVGYQGNVNKYTINSYLQYHSESYAPRAGVINANVNLGYPLKEKIRLRGGAAYFSNEPSRVMSNGSIVDSITTGRTHIFAQMLTSNNGNNYVFQPEYTAYNSNNIEASTAGMRFEYRTMFNNKASFFSTLFAGHNSFPSHTDVDPIFVSNIRLSLRYQNFSSNIRYYYGPFYLNEQLSYVTNQQNPQRLYAMVNHDHWMVNNKIRLNLNLNYNYTTIKGRHQLVSRPEFFYYTDSRFQFSLYANYLLYGNAEYERDAVVYSGTPIRNISEIVPATSNSRVEFGFGVKFNMNMPAGINRNYKATIVVFRDINGNGAKDKNEPGYSNMLIKITPVTANFNEDVTNFQNEVYELITDESGQAVYNHLPTGNYKIETIPLTQSEGWFSGKAFYQFIEGNKKIDIPLSRGARLSGGIFVERDVHTDNKAIQLRGIRVTAVNQLSGDTESALTDAYGNYSMYLPNGDYIVAINEGAVGSRYQFVENNIPISVKNSGENYNVGFYLVELKRRINFGTKRTGNAILRSSKIKDNRDEKTRQDMNLWPVSEKEALGKGMTIKLFGAERDRIEKTKLDTLTTITNIICVEGPAGNYLYLTGGISKKSTAKKLLSKVKQYGFEEAVIVEIKSLGFKDKTEEVESGNKAQTNRSFEMIESDSDKAIYRIQIESSAVLYEPGDFDDLVPDINVIYVFTGDVMKFYSVGSFATEKEAKKYLKSFKKKYSTNEAEVKNYVDEQ